MGKGRDSKLKLIIGDKELNKLVDQGRSSFNEWMEEYEKLKKENEELRLKIQEFPEQVVKVEISEMDALRERWAKMDTERVIEV